VEWEELTAQGTAPTQCFRPAASLLPPHCGRSPGEAGDGARRKEELRVGAGQRLVRTQVSIYEDLPSGV
jgi:hypothetical protein